MSRSDDGLLTQEFNCSRIKKRAKAKGKKKCHTKTIRGKRTPQVPLRTVFAPGSVKKGDLRTFTKFVPSLEKSKKVDLCGQEGINPVEGCEGRLS